MMNRPGMLTLWSLGMLSALGLQAGAQDSPKIQKNQIQKSQAPLIQSVSQKQDPGANPNDTVLSEVTFTEGTKLAGFAEHLMSIEPRMSIVVADDPATSQYTLPRMHLRQVTMYEVLRLVGFLGVQIQETDEHVWILRGPRQPLLETTVQTFSLERAVIHLSLGYRQKKDNNDDNNKDVAKQAFNAILSMLEAALELEKTDAPKGQRPILKVHEETKVLLVKGTKRQIGIIEEGLESIAPQSQPNPKVPARVPVREGAHEQAAARYEGMREQAAAYYEGLREAQKQLHALQAKLAEQQAAIQKLQAALAETRSGNQDTHAK
jgi:hypothetical protein